MAKIPLRHYNREIESLIDRGQTEEAIAHCRHILQTYPKYIEAYRLLGKAFLESQRFGEAADIFQRVLACVPDDFVSQIGMSIIREDEGNLNAALWHMERAFEVQPANTAVQGELRRLYGRRDGLEPPKIRLTRGALVRMYARGDLFQQAIAECRVALAEDPQRPDLQVIMARMHAFGHQKVEAAEMCSSILAKYPYNFEANRILSEILPGTARAEDSQAYRQRVVSLEPYLGLMPPDTTLITEIPDNAVMVDQLDWNPLEGPGGNQPQWAESLGIQFQTPADTGTMPEWLSPESQEDEQVSPDVPASAWDTTSPSDIQSQDTVQETPVVPGMGDENDEALIPDWMKDAGWAPSDGSVPEQPVVFEETAALDSDLAPADIPDWLQSMAPEETPDQDSELPSYAAEETAPDQVAPDLTGIPDWLNNFSDEPDSTATAEGITVQSSEFGQSENMDWLEEFGAGGTPAAQAPDSDLNAQPDELKTSAAPAETQDWLSALPGTETEIEQPQDHPAESADPEAFSAASDTADQDAAMAWLESLAAKHGADEELLFSKAEDRVETPPDWVQEAAAQGTPETASPPADPGPQAEETPDWMSSLETPDVEQVETPGLVVAPSDTVTVPADWGAEVFANETETSQPEPSETPDAVLDLPDWLKTDQPAVESETAEALPAADIPDWLKGLAPEQESSPEQTAEEETVSSPDQPISIPDWLETTSPPQASIEPSEVPAQPVDYADPLPVSGETQAEADSQSEMIVPDLNDQDAAMAWLESLAAKHGADEEVLFSRPEERTDTPPDWVRDAPPDQPATVLMQPTDTETEEISPEPEPVSLTAEQSSQDSETDLTTEDWLEGIASEQEPETEEQPAAQAQNFEPPAWLKEEELAQAAVAPSDQPDWLTNLTTDEAPIGQDLTEETPAEPAGELPAWLQGIKEEQGPEPAQIDGVTTEGSADDLTNWLQGLQTPEAPPAASPPDQEQPEEPTVKLPDWLKQYEEPVSQPAPPTPEPVIPAWIDEVETAPVEDTQPSVEEPATETTVGYEQPVAPQTYTQPLTSSTPDFPVVEKTPLPVLPDAELAELQPVLADAQNHLFSGQVSLAVQEYDRLIQSGAFLQETIHDLREALYRYPVEITIWEKLGDAYARDNQLQEALDAYTKAEELLR